MIRKISLLVAAVALVSQSAHAALPASATTAITTFGTDYGAAVLAVILALATAWGLKKLASKIGWN